MKKQEAIEKLKAGDKIEAIKDIIDKNGNISFTKGGIYFIVSTYKNRFDTIDSYGSVCVFPNIMFNEYFKASEIEMEEEPLYTREQAEQVLKDYNYYCDYKLGELDKVDKSFLDHKFPSTVELTEEELIQIGKEHYEEKEGKKVIIKKNNQNV